MEALVQSLAVSKTHLIWMEMGISCPHVLSEWGFIFPFFGVIHNLHSSLKKGHIKVFNMFKDKTCVIWQMGGGLQVLNGNPYNRKCDVYSFGICLWEIYCCDMPYPDLSFSEITSAVVRQVFFLLCFDWFSHLSKCLFITVGSVSVTPSW